MRDRCWECARRRRVCDSGKPACRKCVIAGIVCPGYGEAKPVTFLAPGQVRSKQHRGQLFDLSTTGAVARTTGVVFDVTDHALPASTPRDFAFASTESRDLATVRDLQPASWKMRTDEEDVVQAIVYLNERFHTLYDKEYIAYPFFHIPLTILHILPPSVQHALTVLALSNRTLSTSVSILSKKEKAAATRQQYHVWRAVSCLNVEISERPADNVIDNFNGILWFMMIELYCAFTPNWRPHLYAIHHLMERHGGFKTVYEGHFPIARLLNIYVFDSIISNTTSPSTNLFQASWHANNADWISQVCAKEDYPTYPCPPPLLNEIIAITYLRSLTKQQRDAAAADGILSRIELFSADEWSSTKPVMHRSLWKGVATTFRSAVTIYALATLFAADVAASGSHHEKQFAHHREHLLKHLKRLSKVSVLVKFGVTWPSVLAGYAMAKGTSGEREHVRAILNELGRACGVAMPFSAIRVLDTFWASGKSAWDDCFDAPYAFVV